MQNIEINTTQNVRITYEVAPLWDRVFAYLIDALAIGAGALIGVIFSAIIGGAATTWVYYLIAVPIFLFYTLVSEILMNGQSWGKKALNLQVVKVNGQEAQLNDYFLRWLFRLIDIYLSFGTMASIFISTSKKGQRMGDLVSETSVIRIKPAKSMIFEELEKNYHNDDYQPTYSGVKQLSEKDMLLVQNVLIRTRKYDNKAQHAVVEKLTQKIKAKLNLADGEIKNQDDLEFLAELIKDYIVITR
ncbi:MAG: RDD family protein [Cyclobacteriaceae bacterium]